MTLNIRKTVSIFRTGWWDFQSYKTVQKPCECSREDCTSVQHGLVIRRRKHDDFTIWADADDPVEAAFHRAVQRAAVAAIYDVRGAK